MKDISGRRYIDGMNADDKKGNGVNDYYVPGERRQGVTFFVLLAIILALVVYLALYAYEYLPRLSTGTLWSAAYLTASLVAGAVVGIFAYSAFNSYRFVQIMIRNSLKASPESFPEVYDMVRRAAERLSMEAPPTYITQSPAVNAYMVRMGLARRKKVIMVNTGLLRAMEGDELLFILGHELSHAKYGRWRSLERPRLPYIISPQYNEYRCDRGGLIASRNIDASVRSLLKLVTGREFIDRVDVKSFERKKDEEPSKVLKKLATHPMIDARIKELLKFYRSPAYTLYQNMQ
jgi:Zn-dependent protease with chaperone function